MPDSLRNADDVINEVYQAFATLAVYAGVFDHPAVLRVLDDLRDVAAGRLLPQRSLLPFDLDTKG